jgi:hypothetical protein
LLALEKANTYLATAGNSQKFRRKTKTAAERFKAFKKCTWN